MLSDDKIVQALLNFASGAGVVFIGFVLTTFVGAFLSGELQRRAWINQWNTQRLRDRAESAHAIFESISRLMDRRLYRAKQWTFWCSRGDVQEYEAARIAYRVVLGDWNDTINHHLAMLQIFFSEEIRIRFDDKVGAAFTHIGALIEAQYRATRSAEPCDVDHIESLLVQLRREVYDFNLQMLRHLENRMEQTSLDPGPAWKYWATLFGPTSSKASNR